MPFAYVPGSSWLHRASPVPKIAWLVATVAVVLVTYDPIPLAVIAAAGLAASFSGGLGRAALRTVVVLLPLAASVVVLQAIAPVGCLPACTPAASVGPLTLYREGMSHAISLVLRLIAMETAAVAMLASTHPSDLFAALRDLHVPHEICLMATMSVQLIPVLQRELHVVLAAQRSRGMRAAGVRALPPLLVPVVVGAFERVTQLALGLESRGFGSGRRSSFRRVVLRQIDRAAAVAALGAAAAGVVAGLSWWSGDQVSVITLSGPATAGIFVTAVALFAVTMASGLRALARL